VQVEAAARLPGDTVSSVASGAVRSTITDEAGRYAFTELVAGIYRLSVQRPGYRGASIQIDLLGVGTAQVTVGLELAPVALRPFEVRVQPVDPFHRTSSPAAEIQGARTRVALQRQVDYLETDVVALSAGEVFEAVTLAESDLFRAMQRLPGVTRRDDYTAVLWTRGAPWDHTRVYYDGMPLFNPTHGGWLFSSVNPDGIGAAHFQPGVRSAAWGEGAAGIVDITSRKGGGRGGAPELRGDLSLASARLTADGDLPLGITWMVAGRRTYVDLITRVWDYIGGGDDAHVPYNFSDLTGRLDVPIGDAILEVSGLLEIDRLRGDIPGLTEGNHASWGNRLGRATLRVPVGPVWISGTYGGTRFGATVEEIPVLRVRRDSIGALPEMETTIRHDRRSVVAEGSWPAPGRLAWNIGVESIREQVAYSGPFSLTGEGIPGLSRDSRVNFVLAPAEHRYTAWWVQSRVALLEEIEVSGGVRLEIGDSVRNAGRRRVAPRFSARWSPLPSTALSASWGRSFQYTQAIGAAAGPLGPQLHLSHVWIQATAGYPAIRSDVATIGAERWLSDDWLLALNVYLRRADGIAQPDPTPGPVRSDAQHLEVENVAHGLEFAVRRLAGRLTTSVAASFGNSEMRSDEMTFPSSADIRQTFDLTSTYRFGSGLRLAGAFSYLSGVPFTRMVIANPPHIAPGTSRTRSYASLDLMLDHSTVFRNREVGGYLQVLNVFGRRNAVTYAGTRQLCPTVATDPACEGGSLIDEFTNGLPRLPLFGIRVRF
jgi:hypothetical protein